MALNFPPSPTIGDIYTYNEYSWKWNGDYWESYSTGFDYLPLSGGTVSGNTVFTNGLTATTISATTYQNLPLDIRVTGATYSNNTFTYTNNTGGTFNVNFSTVTGLTVNGTLRATTLTATTISATTISATTYQNLPSINLDSIFGGGEDGDLNLTSSTLTLTRDSFYNNIILNSDGIITTSNWRLFCRTLTFNGKAFVRNNGQDGSTAPSGSGGGSGTGASAGGFLAAGQAGTAGAAGVVQSNGAQSTVVANLALSPHSNVSGPSGKGGNTALRTGGIAGATNLVTNIKYISTIPFVDTLLRVTIQVSGGTGGRGGSSGASDVAGTAGRGGGGGGGGAGAVVVFAETIVVTSALAPAFTAIGGSGGSGASSSVVDIAGGGGGSGGSGGYIIIVYKEIIGSLLNAVNASGGDGGNGGSGGVSGAAITGGNGGGSGGGGRIVLINVLTGVVTHVIGGNGVAGSAATGTAGASRATATPVTANL